MLGWLRPGHEWRANTLEPLVTVLFGTNIKMWAINMDTSSCDEGGKCHDAGIHIN